MNSKVPKYSTISTNIWAELLREINGVNDDDDGDDEGDDDDDDDDGDAPAGALRIWKFSTERNKKGRKKKKEHFGTGNDNNDIIHEIRNEKKTDSNEEIDMQRSCMRRTRSCRRVPVNVGLPFCL